MVIMCLIFVDSSEDQWCSWIEEWGARQPIGTPLWFHLLFQYFFKFVFFFNFTISLFYLHTFPTFSKSRQIPNISIRLDHTCSAIVMLPAFFQIRLRVNFNRCKSVRRYQSHNNNPVMHNSSTHAIIDKN